MEKKVVSFKNGEEANFARAKTVGKVPPHSVEAEQSVLGGILLDNDSFHGVLEIIRQDDFYQANHRAIFEAMFALYDEREPIDIITLNTQLKSMGKLEVAGGVEYLSFLVDAVPTAANIRYYARIIKEMALRRFLIHEASEIVTEAMQAQGDIDIFLDTVEQRIFKVSEAKVAKGFYRVGDVVKDSIRSLERLALSKDAITGIATGFRDFDELTSGLQKSDLVIIAGRPSMGKTALVLSIARYVGIKNYRNVAIFSLEMSKEQIVNRLLCSEGRVSNSKARSGKFGDNDFPKLVDAAAKFAHTNIFVDDTPAISVLDMRAKARRLHRETPLDLIIVDYLQLMRGSARKMERRDQEISEISASLKALAKELSIPVIALSQLNRGVESRNDKRPIMADLRESGAIEQDADIIGFVYRDEVYNPDTQDKGVAELIISKHRNGAIGTIRLAFQAEYTRFEDLTEGAEYDFLGNDLSFTEEEELL